MQALCELRLVGGNKRWIRCGFAYATLLDLIKAGWVTVDNGVVSEVHVRITKAGRVAVTMQ